MKAPAKALLSVFVGALLSGGAYAQDDCVEIEGTPPGLYTTTDEGRTYLTKDDEMIEMGPGESGFADESGVKCLTKPPEFLDWPCATQAAQSRMFSTYTMADLSDTKNPLQEIVRRYFQIPEVIAPIPNYVDGEYNGVFNYNDLLQFSNDEYWYHPSTEHPFLVPKRPRTLLVSLYVGINKVVIDRNAIEVLRKELGTDDLPVNFVFNDTNVVPISYFGANVSLEEVRRAFFERGIKLAEVPMWWLGDYHLKPTIEEFEQFFDLPSLDDINPTKREELKADLEKNGFGKKPIIVSVLSEANSMVVDQPDRLRVAASMGFKRIPTVFFFVEPDTVLARCGPGTPVGFGSNSISGETTPPGGAVVPPGSAEVPPPSDPKSGRSPPPPPPDESGS
ncbi:MAG: hypothetical protein PVJ33_14600 [Lysobacterales bacterium]